MSKRSSPMETSPPKDSAQASPVMSEAPAEGAPPAKRQKDAAGGVVAGKSGTTDIDPEQMGDVLNAAGVDSREEESSLSKGLMNEPGGLAGARLLHAPKDADYRSMLSSSEFLRKRMTMIAAENGSKSALDPGPTLGGLSNDPSGLVSTSCEEWLVTLLEEAAAYSRHRRLAQNPTNSAEQSEVSAALKTSTRKDKEAEAKHEALKVKLGSSGTPANENKDSDENVQKAANDTARSMAATIGGRKKKFSWMSDGGSGTGTAATRGSSRRQNADPAKFKEVKEESGIVMRDSSPALERKHMGVKKASIRGYAKSRN